MKKLKRLQWKDEYTVGFPALDEQHKRLIETINKAIDYYEDENADALAVFTELSEYLGSHFHAEENIMAAMQYPGREAHGQAHKDFSKKFMELLDGYEKGTEHLPLKLLIFLRDWFLQHVVTNEDPAYAAYFKNLQEQRKARRPQASGE